MEFTFWGVRGTIPVSGRDTVRYGGHTPCVSLRSTGGDLLIIDAGTGIRKVGAELSGKTGRGELSVHLLLTHFHLDHVMGLPSFMPLFASRTHLNIYSAYAPQQVMKALRGIMAGRLFPLEFEETACRKTVKKLPGDTFDICGVRVTICPLNHPQGSTAFQFESEGRRLVYAVDTEHPARGLDRDLLSFAEGADVLVYDAMFTPEEYRKEKRGWGHSTWLAGVRLAEKAGVGRLYLTHYSPDYRDRDIDDIVSKARERFPRTYGAKEKAFHFKEDR